MSISNFPIIGEVVLDQSEKFSDLDGNDKFDLLLADGSEVDEGLPTYFTHLGGYWILIF